MLPFAFRYILILNIVYSVWADSLSVIAIELARDCSTFALLSIVNASPSPAISFFWQSQTLFFLPLSLFEVHRV